MPQFTAGPSARVSPNDRVEMKWSADVAWFGEVKVFDNADGAGTPVLVQRSEDASGSPLASTDHLVKINVGGLVNADTGYFFRVTMTDSTGNSEPLVSAAPLPPFFTGVQAIGEVFVDAGTDRAAISWEANVIGHGAVQYGTATPTEQGPIGDDLNIQDHSIEVTGLSPDTSYQFLVGNRHAIDGDSLAEKSGSFTTQPAEAPTARLGQGSADPRVLSPGEQSTLSVLVRQNADPVSGALVRFEIDPSSRGNGSFNGSPAAEVSSDATGRASVSLQAEERGIVRIQVTSSAASNEAHITVPVRRS